MLATRGSIPMPAVPRCILAMLLAFAVLIGAGTAAWPSCAPAEASAGHVVDDAAQSTGIGKAVPAHCVTAQPAITVSPSPVPSTVTVPALAAGLPLASAAAGVRFWAEGRSAVPSRAQLQMWRH